VRAGAARARGEKEARAGAAGARDTAFDID